MNYRCVDAFAVLLKQWLDAAVAHGDVVAHNFYTYKEIGPNTGQPPQLELPYVAVDIPAGGVESWHRRKANVLRQAILDRTRIAVQIGGRLQVEISPGMMTGGFDTDVQPLVDVVEDFVEKHPTLVTPPEVDGFAGQKVACWFDQPSATPFRVKEHEGHIFWVLLEYVSKTKEA